MSEHTGSLTRSSDFLHRAYRAAVVPGIISYFSSNLALLADGILVGRRVGMDGLASVGMSQPMLLAVSLVGAFLACGAETLCSQALGRNETDSAQRTYAQHLTLMLAFSAVFVILGGFFAEPVAMLLCRGEQTLAPLVREYVVVNLIAAPALMLSFTPFWFLPLEGKNNAVIAMMVIMGLGNILLDFWFLWGLDMGVRGAALASVLSATAATAFGMFKLHSGRHSFSLGFALPRGGEWLQLASAGSPEAFTNLFQALRSLSVNHILLTAGGSGAVAQFSVLTAMAAISEAVTVGVPQSGTAILGVYCGERDTPSASILIKQQLRIGFIGCAILALLLGFGAPFIGWAYEVPGMGLPLWLLGLSLFPVLAINVITGYYRVAGREMLANLLIALRIYGFCILSLLALKAIGASLWLFQITEALLTLLVWVGCVEIIRRREKDKPLSRWLLMDRSLEDGGNSINFTSPSDNQAICDASERIGAFCAANDMAPRQTMRVSLALEEIMTLITQFNPEYSQGFDVRVFAVHGVIGIRIRYGGVDFNPLAPEYADDERFMGIQMVRGLVEETVYQSTFGVNSLLILIE